MFHPQSFLFGESYMNLFWQKKKKVKFEYVPNTVIGGYPKGEIPPRFTSQPIVKRRTLSPLFAGALRMMGDGEIITLVIGTDESMTKNNKHPDVLVCYFRKVGRLIVLGMVDDDIAWGAQLQLALFEWKLLFRKQFDRIPFWNEWFRRI